MPPKRSISKKRATNKKLSGQTIPIYEILSAKQIREPMIDVLPQIERCLKQSPKDLKMNFLNMLVRVCGLEEFSSDIDGENTIEILQNILQKAYDIKKTEISPLILDTRNRFHKDFVKRLRQFFQGIMSEQLGVFSSQQVQFNQSFLGWLEILTKSKLRPIRSASVNFAKILVQEQIKLYQQYHEKKQSKKALTLAKNVSYYLQNIFSQRLKDIDQSIREVAFNITSTILEQLQGDIITETLLNKVYSPLFDQDIIILDLAIKSLHSLLAKCGKNKVISAFIKEHLHKFIQLSKSVQFTGTNVQSLKIIELMHHLQPTLKILNKDYLIAVLQSYASLNLFYGLNAVIQIFYQSLYKTSEQLEANSPIVLLQIITLLMGITSQRNLNTILKSFFVSSKKVNSEKIFNIDTMFNLLLSQFYRDEKNQDISLKAKEISLLLTIIPQWIIHCKDQFKHLIKDKPLYEKILQTYNNHILMNCKQLFFQKMTKHQQLADKYLNLFAHIDVHTLNFSGLENYLDFVIEKIKKLFVQEIQHIELYKEIVNVLYNLEQDEKLSQKYSAKSLILKLGLFKLTSENHTITQSQIYRCSSLLSKFPIQELVTSDSFVCNLIEAFAKSKNEKERMEVLTMLHFIHHYGFMELLHSQGEASQDVYKTIRSRVLRLYLEILENGDQRVPIRLCGFRGLTYMLRILSNKRFQETLAGRLNAYELSTQQMKIVYDYIAEQLFNSDSLDFSSLDVTRMLQRMSLESHEIKSEIIRLLFGLYEESFVFTCHAQSARFIISLIRAQHDLQKQSLNRSHSLPLSLDLTHDLEKRLHSLLQKYLIEQIKQSNLNKLIYWRLCFQIFTLARQDQRFELIMDKLLSSYFSKKKLDPQQRKRLTNKLMIFILHAVDKILERKQYIHLDVYENILRKVHRKFDKQVLIRIKQFFVQKTQGIQSPFVSTFLETLQNISKVQIKKSKKKEEGTQSEQGDEEKQQRDRVESQQSEDQNRDNHKNTKRTGKKSRKSKSKKTKEKNQIMEVEQSDPQPVPVKNPRSTRSQTKKKIK